MGVAGRHLAADRGRDGARRLLQVAGAVVSARRPARRIDELAQRLLPDEPDRAVRAELRAALAVYRPLAFGLVSGLT